MMLFMRDCQRGEMLNMLRVLVHGNMMLVHEGLPEMLHGNI